MSTVQLREGESLSLDAYQCATGETAVYGEGCPDGIYPLLYTILGINGEAGEVAEIIKKELRKGHTKLSDEVKQKLVDELGDVMWYLARACAELDIRLSCVAEGNLHKLRTRKASGTLKDHE